MKTYGGILEISKKEEKEFHLMIYHLTTDMGYGEGGTFGDPNDSKNQKKLDKEKLKVENAIKNLNWIIERFKR